MKSCHYRTYATVHFKSIDIKAGWCNFFDVMSEISYFSLVTELDRKTTNGKKPYIMKNKKTNIDYDDSDMMDLFNDTDEAQGMMEAVFSAINSQMNNSVELTRLIIEKQSNTNMTEEDIINLYKRCTKSVFQTSPLNKLIEQISMG